MQNMATSRAAVVVLGTLGVMASAAGSARAQSLTIDPPTKTTFEMHVGESFKAVLTVSDMLPAYFWQVVAASYPPGVSLTKVGDGVKTNSIAGTPTMAGDGWSLNLCVYPCAGGTCSGWVCAWYYFSVLPPDADAGAPDAPEDVPATETGSDDAPPDAPADATSEDETSDDASTETPPEAPMCSALKEKCSGSADCCDGLKCDNILGALVCCADKSTYCTSDGDCCPPWQCLGGKCGACKSDPFTACIFDAECCAPLKCERGVCNVCAGEGETCEVRCCTGLMCLGGHCRAACAMAGSACAYRDECCSGKCTDGVCVIVLPQKKGCSVPPLPADDVPGFTGLSLMALLGLLATRRRRRSSSKPRAWNG